MSKKLHEIAKKLKRGTNVVNKSTAVQSSQPAPSTAKMRERTPPWLLIEALHQGKIETASAVASQSELTETERMLLGGMLASWSENTQRAEQLLSQAANRLVGVDKCWAHLELAQLYLDLNKDEPTDYHLSRARRYAFEDRQDRQCLSVVVELVDARADIERGARERAHRTLSGLLEDCTDSYLKAVAFYLLGCLGRYQEDEYAASRIENLEQAVGVFQSLPDRYYTALSNLELSYCSIDAKRAAKLARAAADELTALGRIREARTAESAVKSQVVKASSETVDHLNEYEKIGKCLFISAPMRAIRLRLDAIAGALDDPVLILGPRGSGKEMLAQAIHELSPRSKGAMLAINCGALPEQLVESELFGYEKGAFTGATNQKRGLFEAADGGTLFLDEIGELAPSSQAKLLRVLQTNRFRRLGGTSEIETNARVVAATNRDLDEMASSGAFREDLLDRLSVWRLRIPPLSKRREEILPLAEEFLLRYGEGKYKLDSGAKKYLLEKDYPGNVRILENDIRRSIGTARAAGAVMITAQMILEDYAPTLPAPSETSAQSMPELPPGEVPNYEEAMLLFERQLLIHALAVCRWNKKLAAIALGMSERTFWRAIQRHKLHSRPENV